MQHNTHNYIKLEITETARENLNAEPCRCGDGITELFKDMDGLREFLIDRYGRVPNGRNKIYQDTSDGAEEIGFTYSFWTETDWYNKNSQYQTDWISIVDVTETPRLLHGGM